GVGVGTTVIIFLSSLITGLQNSIIDRTLGTQAHVVVRMPDEVPQVLDTLADARVERPAQRIRSIVGWSQVLEVAAGLPGVTAAAPSISGPGLALRSRGSKAIVLRGIDPEDYFPIVDFGRFLVDGRFDLNGFNAVIGTELARDLGIRVGDKIRLQSAGERATILQVSGIIDAGVRDLNERFVFVSLRLGQTLLGLEGGVSTVELTVTDLFAATELANRLANRTGLRAESWMTINSQLMSGLRTQGSSSVVIQTFVILAVALGIASVLAVSVVQKSRESGSMRAVGTRASQVLRIFLIQGLVVGLAGSLGGAIGGFGLVTLFEFLTRNADGTTNLSFALSGPLFVRTSVIAVLVGLGAAALPARRAASLAPADVIRYG
ncbi:MAG: ABC transporter permease, partial [Gemmatimonadales bacterium]|nr:ABC transporter permease [Gemmatimonadales bacterium]